MSLCGGVDDDADALLSLGACGTSDESTRSRLLLPLDEDGGSSCCEFVDESSSGDADVEVEDGLAVRGGRVE